MALVFFILFIVTMFLWLLALLGAVAGVKEGWFAWMACLFLGLMLVTSSTVIVRW